MELKTLQDRPPWDWPRDAGKKFQKILIDRQADETDRLIAAELAGDLTVINDQLADALMAVIRRPDEPEQLRARSCNTWASPRAGGDGWIRRSAGCNAHYAAHVS